MPSISKENKVIALINVFTVEPANQQKVVDMLVRATETTMKNFTGLFQQRFTRVSMEFELQIMLNGEASKISKP